MKNLNLKKYQMLTQSRSQLSRRRVKDKTETSLGEPFDI